MKVRAAIPRDLEVVCQLRLAFLAGERDLAPEQFSDEFVTATRAFLQRHARADTIRSWLAVGGDEQVAGVVSMLLLDMAPRPEDPRSTDGYLINMYVVPRARRRGIGRALLDRSIAEAPALGVRRLLLFSTADGRPLYESAGFAPDADWLDLRLPRPADVAPDREG